MQKGVGVGQHLKLVGRIETGEFEIKGGFDGKIPIGENKEIVKAGFKIKASFTQSPEIAIYGKMEIEIPNQEGKIEFDGKQFLIIHD